MSIHHVWLIRTEYPVRTVLTVVTMWFKILNYCALQVVWYLCVAQGTAGKLMYAHSALGIYVCIHFYASHHRRSDALLVLIASITGYILDSIWAHLQWIDYGYNPLAPFAPLWIVHLWVCFALMLNHSMAWLQNHYRLLALSSAFIAPITYYSSEKIGNVVIQDISVILAIALSWAVIVPLLMYTARVLNRAFQPRITPNIIHS